MKSIRNSITGWTLTFVVCVFLTQTVAAQTVIYVDAGASGTNDGSSWVNAYNYLQDVLADPNFSGPAEIWVAESTYKPDQGGGETPGDRTATFQLISGVAIYGGFPSGGGTWQQRNPDVYETILSGDLDGDDEPDWINYDENSYHVVTGSGTDSTAILDGFTITAGNANSSGRGSYGGAMYNYQSSATVTRCTFTANFSKRRGGAIANKQSSLTVDNCMFSGNSADKAGGAIFNQNSDPVLLNCTFIDNSAGIYGGGVHNCSSSNPTVTNCVFSGNLAGDDGGGMCNRNSSPTLINCTFNGNSANYAGGMSASFFSNPELINCTFSGNSASIWGGGIYSGYNSDTTLTNCTFSGNSAPNGNALAFYSWLQLSPSTLQATNCILWDGGNEIWNYDDSTITITYSDVQGVWPGQGNIGDDPLFVDVNGPDGIVGTQDDNLRLGLGSPCIDAGDNDAVPAGVTTDLDGYPRFVDDPLTTDTGNGTPPIVDMGAYEKKNVYHVDVNAPGTVHDGLTWATAFTDLQDALVAADAGNEIWVAQGTYGPAGFGGDRTATFQLINDVGIYGGFPSGGGSWQERNPNQYETILSGDLNGDDEPNFVNNDENSYHVVTGSGTDETAALDGFTITAGNASGFHPDDSGGGMYNELGNPTLTNCAFSSNSAGWGGGMRNLLGSSPSLTNCTFSGNTAINNGGGMSNTGVSSPTLTDCNIIGNSALTGSGMYCDGSAQNPVILTCNNCVIEEIAGQVDGNSIINLGNAGSITTVDTFTITDYSSIIGTGSITIGVGGEMIIEGNTDVNLVDPNDPDTKGMVLCDGLLRARDNARICNANINVTRAVAVGESPYGLFFVEDFAEIIGNDIHSQGDRYLDMDPNAFNGTVEDNKIYITITEGVNDTPSGLLELRGLDLLAVPPCGPNEYFCEVNEVPPFDVNSWTVQLLELGPGTKVKLTNRFDFGNGGLYEVIYVKNLILGPNSVLDTAFNRLYYENLEGDPNAVKNKLVMVFSLGTIDFDDETEFTAHVTQNNFVHPEEPNYARVHVKLVTGLDPDPCGMMLMSNLVDQDPESPTYGETINARAQGLFTKSSNDEILIRFQYLFGISDPDIKLVVYLCDVPEFLAHDDPNRDDHYIEVARISVPPPGQPGSVQSGRFAVFQQRVFRGDLNFAEVTRIELELIEPGGSVPLSGGDMLLAMWGGDMPLETMDSGGASVLVDGMGAESQCYGQCQCGDLSGDCIILVEDFMMVIGESGYPAEGDPRACYYGAFSDDGYVDSYDVAGYDWTVNDWFNRQNICGALPDPPPFSGSMATMGAAVGGFPDFGGPGPLVALPDPLRDLLIAGKRGTSDAATKIKDRLYIFDSNGLYVEYFTPASEHCNIRVVRGPGGELYQLNSETGVLRLDGTNEVIIPPSGGGIELTDINDPRYDKPANVYVGIQGTGAGSSGRPILDAAFDANDANYVYVVPVVVAPAGEELYTAVAKLELLDEGDPPYNVVCLYADPSLVDRQYRNNLREIELDDAGNLYVINAYALNENDILWKYNTDTGVITGSVNLGNPGSDNYVPSPIGMYVSETELYLASGQRNPDDANSAVIYVFNAQELVLEETITINGMHHATSITGDPSTGFLWVAGFDVNTSDFLSGVDPWKPPFYNPYLAQIPPDGNVPDYVIHLSEAEDLALPMSVVWTGIEEKCGGADLDGSGDINFEDFAILASQWYQAPDIPSADIAPKYGEDNVVNLLDLAFLVRHWLQSGCAGP